MRSSVYKDKILVLFNQNHLLNLDEIHKKVPKAHFVSIYRNVENLCAEGLVKKLVVDKNNTYYELASHDHAHFICNDCNQVTECDLNKQNFTPNGVGVISDVLLRGKCVTCVKTG